MRSPGGAGGEAVASLARGTRGGGELGRDGGLAVAGERDVGQAPQVRGHRVEGRRRPQVARRPMEQVVELLREVGHDDARRPARVRPVDLAVGAVEVAGLVRVQVDAHPRLAPAASDRVDVTVRVQLAAMVLVVESAGHGPIVADRRPGSSSRWRSMSSTRSAAYCSIASPARPARRAIGPAHIRFEHVWFAYTDSPAERGEGGPAQRDRGEGAPGLNYVLRDVSFEVRPGERVGIVGATGSGKTTLVNLLLRFYDIQKGRITVDGVDIRELELAELRGLFSLVLQDVHLFSGTIADNIRLGNASIDDGRVRRAAQAVHADAFISKMTDGYDARVAERGSTLSVGQKQLLSFARALAFDPRVLILDEATSSVDTETEMTIRDALHVLMAGRTTIAVAHRLSTIQDMDQILVLHKGQLREQGTHQALLAQRGIYFKLFELQYAQ